MAMLFDDFAFDETVATVATANTVTALHKRLVTHPLVQYLGDRFTLAEIEGKLLFEIRAFDKTLHKATIIILLTLAYLRSLGRPPIPERVKTALDNSGVKWTKELLALYEPRNEGATDVTRVPEVSYAQTRRSVSSDFQTQVVSTR